MEKKICPHLNCLVYHGEGNPCNCDMARYCPECNKEEPTVKITEDRLKTLEEEVNKINKHLEPLEKRIKLLELISSAQKITNKTLEDKIDSIISAIKCLKNDTEFNNKRIEFIMKNAITKDGIFAIFASIDSGEAFKIGEPLFIKSVQDLWDEHNIDEKLDRDILGIKPNKGFIEPEKKRLRL